VERDSCPPDRFDPHYCRSEAARLAPAAEAIPVSFDATFCAQNSGGSGELCTRKSGEWYSLETPSGGDMTVRLTYPEKARDLVGRSVQSGNLGLALSDDNADTLDESNTPASGAQDDQGTEQVGINVSKGDVYYLHVYGDLTDDVTAIPYHVDIDIR
jgi:hypothetical protein